MALQRLIRDDHFFADLIPVLANVTRMHLCKSDIYQLRQAITKGIRDYLKILFNTKDGKCVQLSFDIICFNIV